MDKKYQGIPYLFVVVTLSGRFDISQSMGWKAGLAIKPALET